VTAADDRGMSNYHDVGNILVLVLQMSGATWGVFLLGYVLVCSVRTLISGPTQSVLQKSLPKARPLKAYPVKAYWLEIKEARAKSPWGDTSARQHRA